MSNSVSRSVSPIQVCISPWSSPVTLEKASLKRSGSPLEMGKPIKKSCTEIDSDILELLELFTQNGSEENESNNEGSLFFQAQINTDTPLAADTSTNKADTSFSFESPLYFESNSEPFTLSPFWQKIFLNSLSPNAKNSLSVSGLNINEWKEFFTYLPVFFPHTENLSCYFNRNKINCDEISAEFISHIFLNISLLNKIKILNMSSLFLLPKFNKNASTEQFYNMHKACLDGIEILKKQPIRKLVIDVETHLEILYNLKSLPHLNTCSVEGNNPSNEDLYSISLSGLPIHSIFLSCYLDPDSVPSKPKILDDIGISYLNIFNFKHFSIDSSDRITDKGLVKALQSSTSLITLSLAACPNITDNSIAKIITPSLIQLELFEVNAKGTYFQKVDITNTNLKDIKLSKPFSIRDNLLYLINSKIETLDLHNTEIPEGFEHQFICLLSTMPNLTLLRIENSNANRLNSLTKIIEDLNKEKKLNFEIELYEF